MLSEEGNPAPSAKISGNNSTTIAGMQKTFSLENHTAGDPLYFAVDYRATSNSGSSGHTNAALEIRFDDQSPYYKWMAFGGTRDTGWQTADTGNISTHVPDGSNSATFRMWYLASGMDADQSVHVDNLYVGTMPRPSAGAGGQAEPIPVEIPYDQLQGMLSGIADVALLCALAEYDESLHSGIKQYMQEHDIDTSCLAEP